MFDLGIVRRKTYRHYRGKLIVQIHLRCGCWVGNNGIYSWCWFRTPNGPPMPDGYNETHVYPSGFSGLHARQDWTDAEWTTAHPVVVLDPDPTGPGSICFSDPESATVLGKIHAGRAVRTRPKFAEFILDGLLARHVRIRLPSGTVSLLGFSCTCLAFAEGDREWDVFPCEAHRTDTDLIY